MSAESLSSCPHHPGNNYNYHDGTSSSSPSTISYVLLAVSGTLEEGFALRPNLDYIPLLDDKHAVRVNATFLGKALIRGYKSFLDIKNPTWREYVIDSDSDNNNNSPQPAYKTVNPAVVPTGCDEHANRYAIYAVDARQALHALAGEPRFLSIAPDMGLADLTAADDLTSPAIKALARAYANNATLSGLSSSSSSSSSSFVNPDRIALLTVTSTWFKSTFVENGILRTDKDGIITDYPESTGIWSKHILNSDKNSSMMTTHSQYPQGCGSNPLGGQVTNVESAVDYKVCIDAAIRQQEARYTTTTDVNNNNPHDTTTTITGDFVAFETCNAATATKSCFVCQRPARYGTDKTTARFNQILTACQLEELMVQAGLVDEATGRGPKFPLVGCSLSVPAMTKESTTRNLLDSNTNDWSVNSTVSLSMLQVFAVAVATFLAGILLGLAISPKNSLGGRGRKNAMADKKSD